jgi:hypothetical protein
VSKIRKFARRGLLLGHLESLLAIGCEELRCLPSGIGNWQRIRRLSFNGCVKLESIPISARDWYSIEHVDILGCRASSDESFRAVMEAWPSLKTLQM